MTIREQKQKLDKHPPQMNGAAGGPVESIVLDLQNVSYVDSFDWGELAEANAVAHNRGGTLRLCHVPKRLGDLLALTKLDSVFECVIDE